MMIALKVVLVLALVWSGLSWFICKNLYFPTHEFEALPRSFGMSSGDVFFRAVDGTQLNGWWIPGSGPWTLLFCHGNAGNISHRVHKAFLFHEEGINVFLFDYRGYGKSRGRPSEQGAYRDGDAAYRYLVETRKIAPDRVLLYGESLGCAIAVELARRHPAGGIILESPFTSTIAMANLFFPWLPAQWIIRDRYDNLSKIPQIHIPILILHSPQDDIVPFAMGRKLFEAASGDKTFFEMTGDHNEGYIETGNRYTEAIRRFLQHLPR